MAKAQAIQAIEHRLRQLGCTASMLQRQVWELADHHEDLKQAGLQEGLAEADAEARANQLLGEPVDLAERLACVLRLSSWWGRHRFIGFCLLPPLGIFAASVAGSVAVFALMRVYFSAAEWAIIADGGPGFGLLAGAVQGIGYLAVALVALACCWLVGRSASGHRWALLACGVCSLQGYFGYCRIAPHSTMIGYSSSPNWICAGIPLVVGVFVLARRRQLLRQAGLLVIAVTGSAAKAPSNADVVVPQMMSLGGRLAAFLSSVGGAARNVRAFCLRGRPTAMAVWNFLVSPTNCIALALIALLGGGAWWGRKEFLQRKAREVELLATVWPAEKTAATERVLARARTLDAPYARTVSLRGYANAQLTEPLPLPADVIPTGNRARGNSLASLPQRLQVLGGVPFAVEGRIQLMGLSSSEPGRIYPTRMPGIPVGQKCTKIFLLHGACGLSTSEVQSGARIAALVLNYIDGSQRKLDIIAGEHVLDWWGPLMTTEIPEEQRDTTAPGTELAWTGTNPALEHFRPLWSLRLYRSQFENPHPEVEISSVDYVSSIGQATPFLVGITLD